MSRKVGMIGRLREGEVESPYNGYCFLIIKLKEELNKVNDRINVIDDKFLDGDLNKEQYDRMLERYTKEASTIQQQVEMRENPNRGNIEPKLNYSINLINNIDSYIKDASVGVKIKLISSMFPEKIEFDGKTYRTNSYGSADISGW